jgi:hypothetical protein
MPFVFELCSQMNQKARLPPTPSRGDQAFETPSRGGQTVQALFLYGLGGVVFLWVTEMVFQIILLRT